MGEINHEILEKIDLILDRRINNLPFDTTFSSVIIETHNNEAYTIYKNNCPYKVPNGLSIHLKTGQRVFVKVPMGNYNEMYICGLN